MQTTATCIVGIAEKGRVYIGSDSASVGNWQRHPTTFPKSFIITNGADKMAIGYTTSFRMGQVLQYEFSLPETPKKVECDALEYMVRFFIPAVKQAFQQHWRSHKAEDDSWGGTFLAGFRGRLFTIDSDFQVNESLHGVDACGCGEAYALGSLVTTAKTEYVDPRERLTLALKAAACFSTGVMAPFHFVDV